MEPNDDPKLSELLREWRVPDAPPSLDQRVLASISHKPQPDVRRADRVSGRSVGMPGTGPNPGSADAAGRSPCATSWWRSWWSFLFTGSIRVPVPAAVAIAAILLAMAAALARQRTPAPVVPSISLVDFRPVADLNVRVIRGSHE